MEGGNRRCLRRNCASRLAWPKKGDFSIIPDIHEIRKEILGKGEGMNTPPNKHKMKVGSGPL